MLTYDIAQVLLDLSWFASSLASPSAHFRVSERSPVQHVITEFRDLSAMAGLPVVTVFGATGQQGSGVAYKLLDTKKYAVRAITR